MRIPRIGCKKNRREFDHFIGSARAEDNGHLFSSESLAISGTYRETLKTPSHAKRLAVILAPEVDRLVVLKQSCFVLAGELAPVLRKYGDGIGVWLEPIEQHCKLPDR